MEHRDQLGHRVHRCAGTGKGCSPKTIRGFSPHEEGSLAGPNKTPGPHKDLTEDLGGENEVEKFAKCRS